MTVSEFVAYLSPADPLEPAGQKSPAQRAFLRLAGRVASMRGRGGTRWFESAELTLEGADRHQTGTLPRELFEDSVCALEAGPTREEATELFASLCGSLHPSCRAPYPSLLRRLRREVGWRRAHASRLRAALRDSADAWRSMHAPWLPRAAAEASLTAGESRTNRTLARTGSMGPHSVQRTRTTRVPAPPRTFSALWRSMDPNGRGAVGIADIAVAYARCGAIAHAHEAVVRVLPSPLPPSVRFLPPMLTAMSLFPWGAGHIHPLGLRGQGRGEARGLPRFLRRQRRRWALPWVAQPGAGHAPPPALVTRHQHEPATGWAAGRQWRLACHCGHGQHWRRLFLACRRLLCGVGGSIGGDCPPAPRSSGRPPRGHAGHALSPLAAVGSGRPRECGRARGPPRRRQGRGCARRPIGASPAQRDDGAPCGGQCSGCRQGSTACGQAGLTQ